MSSFSEQQHALSSSSSIQQKKEIATCNQNIIEDTIEQKKELSVHKLIKTGESITLEFKSSMLTIMEEDLEIKKLQDMAKLNGNDKKSIENRIITIEKIIKDELTTSIIKTILSFLNSKGGILLVGVQDNGIICGIEKDYSYLSENPNWYGWLQHFISLVEKRIGAETIKYIQIKKIHLQYKTIAKIIIKKSMVPVFVENRGPKFYVRRYNTCRSLSTTEANNYILNHWTVLDDNK